MKNFGMVTLLAVLVSCGGSSGSKSKEGRTLDPITQDKFEQMIRSLKPGMVTTETTKGTDHQFSQSENGDWSINIENANKSETETILNITGDAIYTLVETAYEDGREPDREVKKESMEKMIRDLSEPLPAGFSLSINGNQLSMNGTMNSGFDLDATTKVSLDYKFSFSVNLDDIRCSENAATSSTGKLIRNGASQAMTPVSSTSVGGCGRTLSAAELKAIDLSSITLCDESVETEESNCTGPQDLSHLVQ